LVTDQMPASDLVTLIRIECGIGNGLVAIDGQISRTCLASSNSVRPPDSGPPGGKDGAPVSISAVLHIRFAP
jgi:hypothetical protein